MPDDGPDEEVDDLEEEPQLDTSFKQTIVVDGLPVVPEEKHEKLLNLLRKFFSQVSARLATEGGRLA
jgi:translation initiation factor 3 subunit B